MLVVFIDEYIRDRSRKKKCDAIYVTLANPATKILADKNSTYLFCSGDPEAPKDEVYKIVLVCKGLIGNVLYMLTF